MERRGRLAGTMGIVALVVLDIVLVFAALRLFARGDAGYTVSTVGVATQAPNATETRSSSPDHGAAPGGNAATSPPSTSATFATAPSTTATATATEPAASRASPLTGIITAVDANTAWRGTTGSCSASGAALSFTSDGGHTWQNARTPYPVLTRVQPTDASRAFVVGGDPNCVMGVRTTTDSGTTWLGAGPGNMSETLARDTKDPTKVRAPGGRTASPCGTLAVVDVARNSPTGAEALCVDGSIRATTDDGRTWPQSGLVSGALALDSRVVGGTVTTFVARVRPGCSGVAVTSVANGTATDLGCAPTGPTLPGHVALTSPTADAGWLLVGNDTWRSADGLATWTRAE